MLHTSSGRDDFEMLAEPQRVENMDSPRSGKKKKFASFRALFTKEKEKATENTQESSLEDEIRSVRKALYDTKKTYDEQRQREYFDEAMKEEVQRLQTELFELEMQKEDALRATNNSEEE